MPRKNRTQGFSLIEMLLVVAIIGIISGIAIPSFLGQRRRARLIGDAQANAAVIRMSMESRKADLGVYGKANASNSWTASGGYPPASTNVAPDFSPKGNSHLNFNIVVGSAGLTYVLTVKDPGNSDVVMYQTNQNGEELAAYR